MVGLFDIMSGIFPLIFLIVVGLIIFKIVSGIMEWHNNNQMPVLVVDAKVVSRRTRVSNSVHNHGNHVHHSSSTSYFVTFEADGGERMEFHVNGREYGMLAEGDVGQLTFQGTRYHGFERKKNPLSEV